MNILVIPSWYKNEFDSILGSFFREQALALLKKGHRVYVADATLQSTKNIRSPRLFKLCRYNDEGLITYSYVVPAFGISRTPSGGAGMYYRNLKRIYKAMIADGIKIDVIHAHSFYPAGIGAARLSREFNIPLITTEHNSYVLNKKLHPRRIAMLKETVSKSSEFLCVSNALKNSVVELTGTDSHIGVLPNSVKSGFSYAPRAKKDCFTYISIGNLLRGKRFDLTLRAFAKVHSEEPATRLIIVGDGPLREELRSLASELGVSDVVDFKGKIPREELPLLHHQSDCFVLPSDFETFGVVYIEALACGRPVIGTHNGGADEIITPDNGIIIDTDNLQQLYEAMLELLRNYSKYDLLSISERCLGQYGEDVIAETTQELYFQIISKEK